MKEGKKCKGFRPGAWLMELTVEQYGFVSGKVRM
jgi:hypothetical protein